MGNWEPHSHPHDTLICPVCSTPLTLTYKTSSLNIWICKQCGTSLTVPADAWPSARDSPGEIGGGD